MNNPLADIAAVAGIPGRENLSQADLDHAAESARQICSESKIVQNMVANMIIARRLYMIARSALDNEIQHGWNVDDPGLVVHTLVMSATDKANERFETAALQQGLLRTALPMLDILMQQENETGEPICPEQPQEDSDDDSSNHQGESDD